jgi:hypothetical protein
MEDKKGIVLTSMEPIASVGAVLNAIYVIMMIVWVILSINDSGSDGIFSGLIVGGFCCLGVFAVYDSMIAPFKLVGVHNMEFRIPEKAKDDADIYNAIQPVLSNYGFKTAMEGGKIKLVKKGIKYTLKLNFNEGIFTIYTERTTGSAILGINFNTKRYKKASEAIPIIVFNLQKVLS